MKTIPNFKPGDFIIVLGDSDGDDPVAAEFAYDHGIIDSIFQDYATITFLNNKQHRVLLKNLKLMEKPHYD